MYYYLDWRLSYHHLNFVPLSPSSFPPSFFLRNKIDWMQHKSSAFALLSPILPRCNYCLQGTVYQASACFCNHKCITHIDFSTFYPKQLQTYKNVVEHGELWPSTSLTMIGMPDLSSIPCLPLHSPTHISTLPKSIVDSIVTEYVTLDTSLHLLSMCGLLQDWLPLAFWGEFCLESWIAPGTLHGILHWATHWDQGGVGCPEVSVSRAVFHTSFNNSFQPTLKPHHSSLLICVDLVDSAYDCVCVVILMTTV